MAAKQTARQRKEATAPAGDIESERRGSTLLLTLARPDRRNSLSESMIAALHGAIDEAGRDAGVRAVVIAAKGPAFSAGHDLKELSSRRSDADGAYAGIPRRLVDAGLQRAQHRLRQAVAPLGPRQRENEHARLALDLDFDAARR